MNRYLTPTDVPLKFHSFFRNFALPAGAFVTLINLLVSIAQIENFHWILIVNITTNVVFIILNILIYKGFESWPEITWYLLLLSLSIRPLYTIFEVIIYSIYSPLEVGLSTGRFMMYLTYSILVTIYYYKRKFLFTLKQNVSVDSNIESGISLIDDNKELPNMKEEQSPTLHQKYCRNCGKLLPDQETKYCIYCGKEVIFFGSQIIEER